jgi:hypothetical protein
MQERPNKSALLMSIARFLLEEARPALTDPRLNFRALIAANLAGIVANELATDDEHITRELERLRPVVPDVGAGPTPDLRREALLEANARLARWLREGEPTETDIARVAGVLRETLKDKLSVDNPRFDTSLDVE